MLRNFFLLITILTTIVTNTRASTPWDWIVADQPDLAKSLSNSIKLRAAHTLAKFKEKYPYIADQEEIDHISRQYEQGLTEFNPVFFGDFINSLYEHQSGIANLRCSILFTRLFNSLRDKWPTIDNDSLQNNLNLCVSTVINLELLVPKGEYVGRLGMNRPGWIIKSTYEFPEGTALHLAFQAYRLKKQQEQMAPALVPQDNVVQQEPPVPNFVTTGSAKRFRDEDQTNASDPSPTKEARQDHGEILRQMLLIYDSVTTSKSLARNFLVISLRWYLQYMDDHQHRFNVEDFISVYGAHFAGLKSGNGKSYKLEHQVQRLHTFVQQNLKTLKKE